MQLDASQRRDLIVLLCRVAWADGVVVAAEQTRLAHVLHRMGEGAVSKTDLMVWLSAGPPEVTHKLPKEARDWFYDEALRLITIDGDFDPHEMKTVRDLLASYFEKLESAE